MVALFDFHDNEDEMSHLKIPNNSDLPTEKYSVKNVKLKKSFKEEQIINKKSMKYLSLDGDNNRDETSSVKKQLVYTLHFIM